MRPWLALGLMLVLAACAQTRGLEGNSKDAVRGDEAQAQLPEYPKPQNFLPLRVSATTPFEFYVDAKSVGVRNDGVVQYSLIAKSADGTLNVSFEGMHCTERKFRIYAFGRPDNTWSEARSSPWQAMPSDSRNAQRAILYSDFFCPARRIIDTPEEGVQALRSGGHPRAILSGF